MKTKKKVKYLIKDFVNVAYNSSNKQISLNLQKRKMKELGISQQDVLNFYLMRKKKNDKK